MTLPRTGTTIAALVLTALLAILLPLPADAAPAGSAFTFQGRLSTDGAPLAGPVDLRFRLMTAETGGTAAGGPLLFSDVTLDGGVFALPLDFGALPFQGEALWIETAVRGAADPAYVVLAPRQRITPSPYALQAQSVVVNGVDQFALQPESVTREKIAAGAVGAAQVDATQVQRRISAPCAPGFALAAVAQNGTTTCVVVGDAVWTQAGETGLATARQVLVGGGSAPDAPLTVWSAGRYAPFVGEGRGDLHVGNADLGLSIGVALGGGGAGATRIWAKGGVEQMYLGSATHPDMVSIKADTVGINNNNPEHTLDVSGELRLRPLANAGALGGRPLGISPGGVLVAGPAMRYHTIPASALRTVREDVGFFISLDTFIPGSSTGAFILAPVMLPHGAVVRSFRVRYRDSDATHDLGMSLCRASLLGPGEDCPGSMDSSGSSPGAQNKEITGLSMVIDNNAHQYYVVIAPKGVGSTWANKTVAAITLGFTDGY